MTTSRIALGVEVPARIEARFRKLAREAFPWETIAYVLGFQRDNFILVEDLWVPPDAARYSHRRGTRAWIETPDHWIEEAAEQATEDERQLLGDIHSHPYPYHLCGSFRADSVQSEGDLETTWGLIHAVCSVNESKRGRLATRIKWWGPTVRTVTKTTK